MCSSTAAHNRDWVSNGFRHGVTTPSHTRISWLVLCLALLNVLSSELQLATHCFIMQLALYMPSKVSGRFHAYLLMKGTLRNGSVAVA